MPHASVKLLPGVDKNKTPALNEAGISSSQLVRFIPDRTLGGLIQKLGGWQKYFTTQIDSIVRCLWAWEDTNSNSYLGIGAEESLSVLKNGGLNPITPQTTEVDATPDFTTTITTPPNNVVTIVDDSGTLVDQYDVVYIKTQISVGGLILFGLYPCSGNGSSTYNISALTVLGDPDYPTAPAVTSGGVVPKFATTAGSAEVTVTLPDHNYFVGATFPILVETTVGGLTLYGNYTVISFNSASPNNFVIRAANAATSTASNVFMNGGDVRFEYYNNVGPLPPNTGYGFVVPPLLSPPVGLGYGYGGYGAGPNVPPVGTGTPITAVDWTLDNWGEILIANPFGGPIYQWSPSVNDPVASIISGAPPVNNGMFVAMPQRQIIAYGSTFTGIVDPLLIRWSDVNDYTVWYGTVSNQAGSYRIPKGSKIVQAIQGPQQGLVWTDLALWSMQYAGPPFVYQFNELGTGCGLIGRKAAGSMNGVVYWMGQSQFYRYAGSGVEPIRCPIWDVIFQDLDTSQEGLDKIRFGANSRFGEIRWEFPTSSNGGEVSHYVKYNILLDQWDYGQDTPQNPYVARTAWINESVLGPPIGAALNRYIYQHETSTDADGQPMHSSFETGYFVMSEADVKMFVDQVWPDMKWGYYGGVQNATVGITFNYADYAGQTPASTSTFNVTQNTTYVTPRFRGRLTSIRLESSDLGTFWRIGNIRYRFQPDGKF
jgi:hypothetical protein